jgi:hypothetical protein
MSVINPILDNNLCLPTVAAANGEKAAQFCRRLPMLAAALGVMIAFVANTELIDSHNLIFDRSLPKAPIDSQVIAARRHDTFWNTGDEALARAGLAPNFIDSTLPVGRPQGLDGPLAASKLLRAAITHLRFRGHFTDQFGQTKGYGETINFVATDIYRIADARIAESWHLDRNLTLHKQLTAE